MVRDTWNILANTIEVKTRGSYKKCLVFSERHYAALNGASADPVIHPVYVDFEPVYKEYEGAYVKWRNLLGSRKGAAKDLNEALLMMKKKLSEWEGKIFFHYPEGTEQAKTIFPKKRTPFYRGNNVVRTETVGTLIKQLETYPLLAAVKTDVENFYILLSGKLKRRVGLDGSVKGASETLEVKRKKITAEMYGNLGLLMHLFRHNTKQLKNFFDMGVLKNRVHRKKKGIK